MKKLALLFILAILSSGLYSQEINPDSLKQVILNEVASLINKSELKTTNDIKQLGEQLKQLVESNSAGAANDVAIDLANSAKEEAVQQANELIEGKAENILVEVENMINQSKMQLTQELEVVINESNKQSTENFEVAVHNSEEKTAKRASELIDEKFSEVHQFVIENIQNENQNLIDKVNEQGDLISKLLKRVEELEKK